MAIAQKYLEQVFNAAILAEDASLSPALEQGQDLYFKRKGYTQVAAIVTQETSIVNNNIFPVSSNSTFLYKHAANLGMPLFVGALPSYGTVRLFSEDTTTAPSTFTVTTGTILTSSSTGVKYEVMEDTLINSGTLLSSVAIPIQSILSGKKTYISPGNSLIIATPYIFGAVTISTAIVNNDFVAGQDTPTDLHISNSIYQYAQYPRGSGSAGDYAKWALQSNSTITQTMVIPNYAGVVLVAIMGGSSDPLVNIELSYPISREVPLSIVDQCSAYLESQRPLDVNVNSITVSTLALSSTTPNYVTNIGLLNPQINLNVVLDTGLNLNTEITGANGETKSVRDWILYQFRFAILSAPYGGVTINGNTVLLGEQITTILSNGLGATQSFNGYLCSILLNATFTYTDANVTNQSDIPVPNQNEYFIVGNPSTINIIYDIDTTIINIIV